MSSESTENGQATDGVLGSLDPDVAEVVRGYLVEPIASIDILEDQVSLYAKELESQADEGAVFDLEYAISLARQCQNLLAAADSMGEEHRRLVQAATRYFCVSEDADGDTESLIGFDDDGALIEAVALAIGRGDLIED